MQVFCLCLGFVFEIVRVYFCISLFILTCYGRKAFMKFSTLNVVFSFVIIF